MGLNPFRFRVRGRAKVETLAYLDAKATANARTTAKTKAQCGGLSTALRFGRDDGGFGLASGG